MRDKLIEKCYELATELEDFHEYEDLKLWCDNDLLNLYAELRIMKYVRMTEFSQV